jgi:hypothetical protein
MKRTALGIVSLTVAVCLGCTGHAQNRARLIVRRAVGCLSAKGFLPRAKASKLTLGYLIDERSYPGKAVLYLVDYPSPSQPAGVVFTIFLSERNGRHLFNIQNNARFAPSGRAQGGVKFLSPPLGGTWTREHLAAAVRRIAGRPRFTLSLSALRGTDNSVSCEAYTDPRPGRPAR